MRAPRHVRGLSPRNVVPPAIELILREAVLASNFVLELLIGARHGNGDRQPPVFFVAKLHFDGRLDG